jgi:hypothetical protein
MEAEQVHAPGPHLEAEVLQHAAEREQTNE